MAAKFISILAIPRTGTNYLCGLLGKFEEIDSLYEIYHNKAVYIGDQKLARQVIDYINCKYQLQIKNHQDISFINFVNQNPQEILDIIRLKSTNKYISFKVFPNHLSTQKLNQLIISNKQIIKILIKRNLLDVYLSLKFARVIKKWSGQDTSSLKLDFDSDDFLNWYACYQQYYEFVERELHRNNSKASVLTYETIHSYKTNHDKFVFLFNYLQSIGLELNDSNLSITEEKLNNLRTKQDDRVNALDKVSNPNLLLSTLQNNQLEFLLTDKE